MDDKGPSTEETRIPTMTLSKRVLLLGSQILHLEQENLSQWIPKALSEPDIL